MRLPRHSVITSRLSNSGSGGSLEPALILEAALEEERVLSDLVATVSD